MKGKIFYSVLVIALVLAIVGGATMAWLTSNATVDNITFAVGTVAIEANQTASVNSSLGEISPGDVFCVSWDVTNNGSLEMALRLDASRQWTGFQDNPDDPAHIAICPGLANLWKIIPSADGATFEVFYTGGPIAPGDTVRLVLVAAFDGGSMGNEFQNASFTLSGNFEAVQATNGAPAALWENWDEDGQPDDYFGEGYVWPDCCPQPEPVTYTVTVNAEEGGSAEGGGTYGAGTAVTLTAIPEEGYNFAGWKIGEMVVSTNNSYTFTPTADVTVVALFTAEPVVFDHYEVVITEAKRENKGILLNRYTNISVAGNITMIGSDGQTYLGNDCVKG